MGMFYPGAIACGYQAAKATLRELNGEPGYPEYTSWWQKSFEGNHPTWRLGAARFGVLNELCTNEEVDYLYGLVEDQIGVLFVLVGAKLEQIRDKRPGPYAKLKQMGFLWSAGAVCLCPWHKIGVPPSLNPYSSRTSEAMMKLMPIIKQERPDIFQKLKKRSLPVDDIIAGRSILPRDITSAIRKSHRC